MPEPFSLALAVTGPALNGLSKLIVALKEPLGKKKMEDLKSEVSTGLKGLQTLLEEQVTQIERLEKHMRHLEARIVYVELPFYRKWFTPKPMNSSPVTSSLDHP